MIDLPTSKTVTAFCSLALVASFAADALAGPAIATRYTETARLKPPKITQEACLTRAEAAITKGGFDKIQRTALSRYGTAGDYTAAIRCMVDKQIVFMIVSGPTASTADERAGGLFREFEASP